MKIHFLQHRIAFATLALTLALLFILFPFWLSQGQVITALILFFALGIPHGALDYALGSHIFKPGGGRFWQLLFLGSYLAAIGFVLVFWFLLPLPSFLFFLLISALHFGFSDVDFNRGSSYYFEGAGRGILPIAAPAYFYPLEFQKIIENSLKVDQALLVTTLFSKLFLPCCFILLILIVRGLWMRTKSSLANSFELIALITIFTILTPFTAFLIYFCFLHSTRHILNVLDELNLPLSFESFKWVFIQALPATLVTFLALLLSYLYIRNENVDLVDLKAMFNLFFVSLAALTFPHMLLVEFFKWRTIKRA